MRTTYIINPMSYGAAGSGVGVEAPTKHFAWSHAKDFHVGHDKREGWAVGTRSAVGPSMNNATKTLRVATQNAIGGPLCEMPAGYIPKYRIRVAGPGDTAPSPVPEIDASPWCETEAEARASVYPQFAGLVVHDE